VSAAGGSRLEDELVITLNKALAQSNPGYKRIGIMGSLALLQQEGATYELLSDADGTAAGGSGAEHVVQLGVHSRCTPVWADDTAFGVCLRCSLRCFAHALVLAGVL
jgi:hypothetical protein